MRPSRASARAFSRVSAMCQLSSTRQFLRSTVWPCLAAAASAKPHCVGSALRPSSDREPIEMTPIPCLPARIPDGLICRRRRTAFPPATAAVAGRVLQREYSLFSARSPRGQPADDADRASDGRAPSDRFERVRPKQARRVSPEDRPPAGVSRAAPALRGRGVGQQRPRRRCFERSPAAAGNISGDRHLNRSNGVRRTRIRRSQRRDNDDIESRRNCNIGCSPTG